MSNIKDIKRILDEARNQRARLAARLESKEKALNELLYSPIPDDELLTIMDGYIDARAEDYAKKLVNTLHTVRSRHRSYDPNNDGAPRINRPDDFLMEGTGPGAAVDSGALYFFMGDQMKARIRELVEKQDWQSGLPTKERGARESKLLDEIAALEKELNELETAILGAVQV